MTLTMVCLGNFLILILPSILAFRPLHQIIKFSSEHVRTVGSVVDQGCYRVTWNLFYFDVNSHIDSTIEHYQIPHLNVSTIYMVGPVGFEPSFRQFSCVWVAWCAHTTTTQAFSCVDGWPM